MSHSARIAALAIMLSANVSAGAPALAVAAADPGMTYSVDGNPVAGSGSIFSINGGASDLPVKADREMFLVKDDLSPNANSAPRSFTEAENRAIEKYITNGKRQPTRSM